MLLSNVVLRQLKRISFSFARCLCAPVEDQEEGIGITGTVCCLDPLLCPAINRVLTNPLRG